MQFAEKLCYISQMYKNNDKNLYIKISTDTPHWNRTYKKWQNHTKPTVTYAKVAIKNYNKK